MKAIKSLILTVILLGAISVSCGAQSPLLKTGTTEFFTKEEFILKFGEDVYKKNVPVVIDPAVKKPAATIPVKAETQLIKNKTLLTSRFFQK